MGSASVRQRAPDRGWSRVLASFLVVLFALGCIPVGPDGNAALDPVGRLAAEIGASVGSYRAFEARLSTDVGYVECRRGGRCSPPPRRDSAMFQALGQAGLGYRAERDHPSLHAQGLWRALWASGPGELDGAIDHLERALDESAGDARLRSDLAALCHARARVENRAEDLVAALEYARAAVALDPDSLKAQFNLALILEELSLRGLAQSAWKRYLALEKGQDWAREGRVRLGSSAPFDFEARFEAEVSAPMADSKPLGGAVASHPELSLDRLLQHTLPLWADAWLADEMELAESLLEGEAAKIATAVARGAEERIGAHALANLRRLHAEDPELLKQAALGIQALERGRQELREPDLESALPELSWAVAALDSAGSPLALQAGIWLSLTEIYTGRHERAYRRLTRILDALASSEYPTLAARAHWYAALTLIRRGMDSEAIEHLSVALRRYRSSGFDRSEGAIQMLLAERLDRLAPQREAWTHRSKGLERLAGYPTSLAFHNLLLTSATAAEEAGHSTAALAFLEEARRVALLRGGDSSKGEVFIFLGRHHRRRGERDEARRALAQSERYLATLPPSKLKERLLTDAEVETALLDAEVAPEAALSRLARCAETYRQHELHIQGVDTAVASAQLGLAAGDALLAQTDLEEALARLLRQNRDLVGLTEQIHHATRLRPLLEDLIELEYGRGRDPLALLALANQALFLQVAPASAGDVGSEPVRPGNGGEREIVVVFFGLEDRLLRWEIADGLTRMVELPVGRAELETKLIRLLQAHQAEDGVTGRALGSALFAQIFDGIDLGSFERLTLVVDRPLHLTPFATLVDERSGRYLIELVDIRLALTVAGLQTSRSGRGAIAADGSEGVTLIGDPNFDRAVFPWLPPLAGSRREVEALAQIYPTSTPWLGDRATRQVVIDRLARTRLFHYAGHTLASSRQPGESYLVLAPAEGGGASRLTARDLAQLEMPALELAVLSACTSIGGRPGRRGVLGGLSAVFLAKGASAVVGTLWRVSDQPSAWVMVEFHKALRSHPTAAQALAAAQRAALASGYPKRAAPSSWGAFSVITRSAFEDQQPVRS